MTQHNTPRIEDARTPGRISEYRIDKKHYTQCNLETYFHPKFYVKKFYISKGETLPSFVVDRAPYRFLENGILYVATTEKHHIVYDRDISELQLQQPHVGLRTCTEGKHQPFNFDHTSNDAKGCGLSTILAYLCYRDREVDPMIIGTSGTGYDFVLETKKGEATAKVAALKLKKYAKRKCKRIIKVSLPVGKDPALGRAYITAGMDAGYGILMTFNTNNPFRKIFIVKTQKLVESFEEKPTIQKPKRLGKLQFQATPNSKRVIDPVLDKFVANYGNNWYLCKKYRFFKEVPK